MDLIHCRGGLSSGKRGSLSAASLPGGSLGRDEGVPQSPDVDVVKRRSRKAGDLGSSKKSKKKQSFLNLINLEEEVGGDSQVALGVERESLQFLGGEDRHLVLKSGLADSGKSIVVLRKRPFWVKDCDMWARSLVSRGLRHEPVVVDRRIVSGMGYHLGFVYLPTDLRTHADVKEVPIWNRWDPLLPTHFFSMSKQSLVDDGFLAVLHSGEFSHATSIFTAAEGKSYFKHVQSYTILLPKPLWKANSNLQVLKRLSIDGFLT